VSEPNQDDDKQQAMIARLTAERDHARAQLRRAHDELDFSQEKIRVLERVIERLSKGG
jgi:septal ring factor EnvC (AmiA/AmiB activator)